MFITACPKCYDGKMGEITGINRIDDDEPICPKCKGPQYLVYTSRQLCGGSGGYELTSAALAISPSQIKAHKKLFPNVGILPDGQLQFTSFRSHDKYLEDTGFVKHTQKLKVKGKIVG